MEHWNEKLKGFLYYIPGCEKIILKINDIEVFKGYIVQMPKKYQQLEVEELRGKKIGNKQYLYFTAHWPGGVEPSE